MEKQNKKVILIVSELKHEDMLMRFLDEHSDICKEEYLIIPLDAELEDILTEKGISFESGRGYRTPDIIPMTLAGEWVAKIFESKRWSFFTYRGVSLGQLYFLPLHSYMATLLYYADIVSNVIIKNPSVEKLIVFPSMDRKPLMGHPLSGFQVDAIIDAAVCIGKENCKEIVIPHVETNFVKASSVSFTIKRTVFGWGIGVINMLVAMARRPHHIRILVSDYWKNIAPYLQKLDSVEVVMIDRIEVFRTGLSNIWKYRMRFLHSDTFSSRVSTEHENAKDIFLREWSSFKEDSSAIPSFFRELPLHSVLYRVLDTVVMDARAKTLKIIDDTHTMLVCLKPKAVLLRSTVSTQLHFVTLAQAARAQGIPSIEVQHGLEYYCPHSFCRKHSAEYIGVYGSIIENIMKDAGDENSKPVIVGSPRFDVYASLGKEKHTGKPISGSIVSVLCFAPAWWAGGDFDTYDIEDYYSAVGDAVRGMPNVQVVIKFRPGPNRDSFARARIASFFTDVSYQIAQFEPLVDLFAKADIVISCYSTASIEALQCGKPLVFLGLSPMQRMLGLDHFPIYEKAGAMRIAVSKEELTKILRPLIKDSEMRKNLSEGAIAFLEKEYILDGHASDRVAELIRSVSDNTR